MAPTEGAILTLHLANSAFMWELEMGIRCKLHEQLGTTVRHCPKMKKGLELLSSPLGLLRYTAPEKEANQSS
jgi:hypothetical protein